MIILEQLYTIILQDGTKTDHWYVSEMVERFEVFSSVIPAKTKEEAYENLKRNKNGTLHMVGTQPTEFYYEKA